jgi:type IV pilus assembly protein PilQ
MNSLSKIRGALSALVLAAILSSLAVTVPAQTTQPQQQGKRYGEPGFVGEPINLNVVNADIRDILSYITDQYGINFVIDKSVKDVPVTVKVTEVPWNLALDSILQSQELGIQVNGNILRVADNKTLAAEGELVRARQNNQIDTSPLVTEMIRLNYATAAGALGAAQTTSGLAVGAGDTTNIGGASGSNTTGGDGLLPIIKRRLSRRGSIEIDSRSNSLIITDVQANMDAIKQLIRVLDQPEPQVEIEARIVVATRNFSRDIGVQLGALVRGGTAGAAGGTLPGLTSSITPPPGQPIPSITNDLASRIANTAIGLTTGVFGTAQISAIISAGEQKGQAKVIATPRVTALNNRPAEIKSGSKIPVTTVQPGSPAGGAVVATTTYVDVPLRLSITPQITDVGTVILNVVAENSSTAAIVGGSGAPAINTQSMTTQVTVPDGGTTVVGGVLFDDERNTSDRTPGLSNVPVLGRLFRRDGVSRNTNEILFFITPRITRPEQVVEPRSSGPILQPVPMGNPPSNSTKTDVNPMMLTTPGAPRPELVPVPTPKQN